MLNGVDIFSGIGCMSLGLKKYVKPLLYCEKNKYCQKVLKKAMSAKRLYTAPIFTDITKLRSTEIGSIPVDIIYGGFPCQDISLIGNREGLKGKESGLIYEVFRLVKELKPKYVFLENVYGIMSKGHEEIVQYFKSIGYDSQWDIVSAEMFGAPHIRKRWFLLATKRYRNNERTTFDTKLKQSPGHNQNSCQVENIFNPKNNVKFFKNFDKQDKKRPNNSIDTFQWQTRTWYSREPRIHRVAYGSTNWTYRCHALGNSVVPICVKYAFLRLLMISKLC